MTLIKKNNNNNKSHMTHPQTQSQLSVPLGTEGSIDDL